MVPCNCELGNSRSTISITSIITITTTTTICQPPLQCLVVLATVSMLELLLVLLCSIITSNNTSITTTTICQPPFVVPLGALQL